MDFKYLVLVLAVILLIVCLVFMGIFLMQTRSSEWPPSVKDCPDYWDPSGNYCVNTFEIGFNDDNQMNQGECATTEGIVFSGDQDGLCAKKAFAENCEITWDGVTNAGKTCD
jgi:hypothetical protein